MLNTEKFDTRHLEHRNTKITVGTVIIQELISRTYLGYVLNIFTRKLADLQVDRGMNFTV